jgi:hypothetical protein
MANNTEKLFKNLSKQHIYLMFDIQNRFIQKVGEVQIRIHKESEIDKWKNPELVKQEAIDYFKQENQEYKEEILNAFYTGDLMPTIELKKVNYLMLNNEYE